MMTEEPDSLHASGGQLSGSQECVTSSTSQLPGSTDKLSESGDTIMQDESETPSSSDKELIDPAVRIKMIARVAVSNAHFKHQQIGEPDLTLEEKIDIAQNIFYQSKVTFLSKFWNYLELEDIVIFQDCRNIYEVDFYVKQIIKSKNSGLQRNKVKNRRYEAMKELISTGEYFSEDEMKFREPYLYDQMIGQYLSDDEIQAKVDKTDLTFSNILLNHIDQLDENARFGHARDVEEGQEEESEDDDDEDNDSKVDDGSGDKNKQDQVEMDFDPFSDDPDDGKPKISAEKKKELRQEFLTLMQEKFLQGEDKAFDYSKVDNDDRYDDLTVLNADAEEKYFDDEDPEIIHSDSKI